MKPVQITRNHPLPSSQTGEKLNRWNNGHLGNPFWKAEREREWDLNGFPSAVNWRCNFVKRKLKALRRGFVPLTRFRPHSTGTNSLRPLGSKSCDNGVHAGEPRCEMSCLKRINARLWAWCCSEELILLVFLGLNWSCRNSLGWTFSFSEKISSEAHEGAVFWYDVTR